MIVTHASEAAYKAAEKSEIESTVGLIESSNRVVIDGVNVVTDNPGIGDILCIDENRKYRFIQLDTYKAGVFPAAWETLGVVVMRKGNIVTVCDKEMSTEQAFAVFSYVVTGQVLDGAEHSATLKLHGSETFDFKYTANSDEEFVEALKSFLSEHDFTDWSAYIMDGKVILQYDNYTSREYADEDITWATGLTLTDSNEYAGLEKNLSGMRYCGNAGNGVWSTALAIGAFKADNASTAFNPATDIDKEPPYVVCWPAFAGTSKYQSDHCLWLRQKYCKDPDNPKIEEWEHYVDMCRPVIPYMYYMQAPESRDGRAWTDRLAAIMYKAADGTMKAKCPAAAYCRTRFDGKGYLPSLMELCEAFEGINHFAAIEDADPISRSLVAMGGQEVMYKTHRSSTTGFYQNWFSFSLSNSGVYDASSVYSASVLNTRAFMRIELPLSE